MSTKKLFIPVFLLSVFVFASCSKKSDDNGQNQQNQQQNNQNQQQIVDPSNEKQQQNNQNQNNNQQNQTESEKSPDVVVEEFYRWYSKESYYRLENNVDTRLHRYLSELQGDKLVTTDIDIVATGSLDPVTCSQDIPPVSEFGEYIVFKEGETISENEFKIEIETFPQDKGINKKDPVVYLKVVDGKWLINKIECK
ncbi:MAG: hypothetical protein U9O20_04525 [Patescibacteria group bacterium]|nr:hypothetical protein [Patescibacteria group bacterium]